jgi:methenyltetrahydromethanopterin cyclohydrolase
MAPLPPVAADELNAIGRTNDAILYGGRVVIWVRAEDDVLADIGHKVPSSSCADHGVPFAAIFERYNKDFYKIDPLLFSPAQIVFHNLRTGRSHTFGRIEPEILKRSFWSEG